MTFDIRFDSCQFVHVSFRRFDFVILIAFSENKSAIIFFENENF